MSSAERYRLVRTVASGGMAEVVEAIACGLHGFERRVAIKRLLPQHAHDQERRRMFLEEARIGSRLHHGGIVPIFDYGRIDGSEFLAMEYVDGLDAMRALETRPSDGRGIPEGIALHITAEVAHALAYIHDLRDGETLAGFVHRDVSPANILLSWSGDVMLSDFGIALARFRDSGCDDGGVKGKLNYMAPEQARGESVGTAADIYALGATLDALLGGQAVCADPSSHDRLQDAERRGVSPAICAILRDCLASDPATRPPAAEVAARAGALASLYLGRDGRSALRDWLDPLRSVVRSQSALDDLMGLCLVPVSETGGDRSFTVTRAWESEPARRTSVADRAKRPAQQPALTALTMGMLLAALLVVWRIVHETHGRTAVAATAHGMQLDARRSPAAPTGELQGANAGAAAGTADDPPAPLAMKHGWLRVDGEALLGAIVAVDATFSGFAPLELALPVGLHVLTISVPGSGRVLVHKQVQITERQTRGEPLRVVR